jgi:quinol-cytochrome oxidoreductase complex cytochrome b subunit
MNFLTGLLFAGTFFSSNIYLYFGKLFLLLVSFLPKNDVSDPRYKLFGVMASFLVAVGALTGGSIGMLLPKISTGIVLGSLVATLTCVVSERFQ